MGIFDKLTGKHKDSEQEDPNLQQQGSQQGYETSQDMGTAQSNIGQQPQGGYDDQNMSDQGYQDPSMSDQGYQDPNMSDQGYQDPNEDPDMGDEQQNRGNQGR